MTADRAFLRISAGHWRLLVAVFVAGCVLQLLHIGLREHVSLIDYQWATWQYTFSLILLGPLASGCGASIGRRLGRHRWLMRGHETRALTSAVSAVGLALTTSFLLGLLSVSLLVASTGAPLDSPDLLALTVTSLIGLFGYVAIGCGAGLRWPRRFIAVTVTAATFAATMTGWLNGWEVLVRFGGASGGLVGSRLSTWTTVVRLAFWASVVVVVVIGAAGRVDTTRLRLASTLARIGLLGGLIAAMVSTGVLERGPVSWACTQSIQAVCVPSQYAWSLEEVRDAVENAEFLAVLASAPQVSRQWTIDDGFLIHALQSEQPESSIHERLALLSQFWFAPGCWHGDTPLTAQQEQATFELRLWIDAQAGVSGARDFAVDLGVPVDLSPASRAFVHHHTDSLPACPAA